MKILFAADGSKYTRKALAFLVNHGELAGEERRRRAGPQCAGTRAGRVKTMLGSSNISAWHAEESEKVLAPIERFTRHKIAFKMLAV